MYMVIIYACSIRRLQLGLHLFALRSWLEQVFHTSFPLIGNMRAGDKLRFVAWVNEASSRVFLPGRQLLVSPVLFLLISNPIIINFLSPLFVPSNFLPTGFKTTRSLFFLFFFSGTRWRTYSCSFWTGRTPSTPTKNSSNWNREAAGDHRRHQSITQVFCFSLNYNSLRRMEILLVKYHRSSVLVVK